jgi:hypothetical protein
VTFLDSDGEHRAAAALQALSGRPCAQLQGAVLACKHGKWVPSDDPGDQELMVSSVGRVRVGHSHHTCWTPRVAAAEPLLPAALSQALLQDRQLMHGQQQQEAAQAPVALTTQQAGIPGLQLFPDFVSAAQEAALVAHIDSQPWQALAKRRVQHYGYVFAYEQRGVDLQRQPGGMPAWAQDVVAHMQVCVLGRGAVCAEGASVLGLLQRTR